MLARVTAAGLAVALCLPAALRADDAGAGKGTKVGEPAPRIYLYYADGNFVPQKSMDGKSLLLTFWTVQSLKSKDGAALFEQMKRVRLGVAGRDDFVLISVWVDALEDDKMDDWSKFLLDQGTVDYGDGRRRFIDDSRWWGCMEVQLDDLTSKRFGVGHYPEAFLIGPDGKLLAADVPGKEVVDVVARALMAGK
jgi:hypothetical protein